MGSRAQISSQQKIEVIMRRFSRVAAIFSMLVGLVVLMAWKLAVVVVVTAGSSRKGMARSTALALLFSGASLLALQDPSSKRRIRRLGTTLAVMAILISSATLLRLLGVLPQFLDENSLFGPLPMGNTFLSVEMAPNTALCLILAGLSLVFMNVEVGSWRPGQWCALPTFAISLAACIGYAYDVRALYGIAGYANMAVHTATTLLILSLGLLFARPRDGLMTFFSQVGPVGTLVRRLFPVAIAIPILGGWIRLKGQQAGWYGTAAGTVLDATLDVILLLLFLYLAMSSRAVAERKFSSLLESAPDPMVIVNAEGAIVAVNEQTEKLFGYSRPELLGKPVETLMPEGLRKKHVSNRTQYSHSPVIRPMGAGQELSGLRRDGAEFPIEVSLAPMESDEGLLFSSTVRDITERKRAEQTLREGEERFRVALKGAPIYVFNQDRELRYTWINSPGLAWAESDYTGRTDAEIVGGEEGARLTAIKQRVLQTGVGARVETVLTHRGEPHHFDLTVEPLRDIHGDIVGITCACADITQLKQGAAERDRLIRELQDALAQVKMLRGLLPICASCKKIRNETGEWNSVEKYIRDHADVDFTHGICPECARSLYPDFFKS